MNASWVHPELHPVFEALGYVAGYLVYRREWTRQGDALNDERRWMVIAAAAVGALVGSRVLGLLAAAPGRGLSWHDFLLPGGKTIVGGLLGGWLAVELAKRAMGLRMRTGDLFAVPLCVGIAVGRIGCFFAGLADDTYGKATRLPWGVDFGDGVRRHPTQIYEMVFLLLLGWGLRHFFPTRPQDAPTDAAPEQHEGGTRTSFIPLMRDEAAHEWGTPASSDGQKDTRTDGAPERSYREGSVFRIFLAAYLAWRLAIDFLKPQPLVHGLNVIQWACVAGIALLGMADLLRRKDGVDAGPTS